MPVLAYCWKCGMNIYSGDEYEEEQGFYTCKSCLD